MSMKYVLIALGLAAVATPALAANEFYVVKDGATGKCSVVEQKPTAGTTVQVGTTSYKTQAEATTAMTSAAGCATK